MLSKQKEAIEKARKEGKLEDLQVPKPSTSTVISSYHTEQVPPESTMFHKLN
ncbi:hypothetical protein GCM10009865_51860 [Aeromicrobium ponti]|uniref:Uncharacterized protein n=1 Tax=Cytobacillus oceanisediminis TaxID=665099 RepID=A0A562J6V7_9BACI|nr:hypothetical protein IQ19_05098 [Cytobacillus oceanisediminis]